MSEYLSSYGPRAIVAGASHGIGEAIAEQLAAKGFDLVLIARTQSQLEANAARYRDRYGVDAIPLIVDLSRGDAADTIMAATKDLDIGLLVYNAAIGFSGPFWERGLDYYHAVLGTNVLTPFDLVYKFAPRLMRQRRGGIIMVSSAAGQTPQPYLIGYSGTKAWNTNFSMGLWQELRPYHVDVFNPIVGSVDTPGLRDMMSESFLSSMKLGDATKVAREIVDNLGKAPTRVVGGLPNRLNVGFFRLVGLNGSIKLMSTLMKRAVYKGRFPAQPAEVTEPHVAEPHTST
jgi:short-subunit dehydrogenase